MDNLKHISKYLSLILRHRPESIGIVLSSEGWVLIDDLIQKSKQRNINLSLKLIQEVIDKSDKKRFEINSDMKLIRAAYGHSIPVDLGYIAEKPPDVLYHGTPDKNIVSIKMNGLQKKGRNYVHLSTDYETAKKVGSRRGKPFVLIINSKKMYKDGIVFYRSHADIWLTRKVEPQYIKF
jgi:putative RNA 2'-phosphotransferase